MAFRIRTYSTFLPFSYVMFLYFGFTSHIISTNLPSNFMRANLSSGSDAWRYDPRTSKFCNSLPSWTSIINYAYSASITMFGDVAPSCGIQVCSGFLYAHVLPLILTHHYSLMILMACSGILFLLGHEIWFLWYENSEGI